MGFQSAIPRFLVAAICLCFSLCGSDSAAQNKKADSPAALAAYNGADREQRLLAGAKAEGKVVWYTSLAGSSYKELTLIRQ